MTTEVVLVFNSAWFSTYKPKTKWTKFPCTDHTRRGDFFTGRKTEADLGPHTPFERLLSLEFHARVHGCLSTSIWLAFLYECGSAWGGRQQEVDVYSRRVRQILARSAREGLLTCSTCRIKFIHLVAVHASPYSWSFRPSAVLSWRVTRHFEEAMMLQLHQPYFMIREYQ